MNNHTICNNSNNTQNTECALTYLKDIVAQAYRRDPSEEEWILYEAMFYQWGLSTQEALSLALQVLLQSPQFLYISPQPTETVTENMSFISSTERLALLTLFLHNSLPSKQQYETYGDRILSRADMHEIAQELLSSNDTSQMVYLFHRDWLHLFRLYEGTKDQELYPFYTSTWANHAVEAQCCQDIFGIVLFDELLFSTGLDTSELQQIYMTTDNLSFRP